MGNHDDKELQTCREEMERVPQGKGPEQGEAEEDQGVEVWAEEWIKGAAPAAGVETDPVPAQAETVSAHHAEPPFPTRRERPASM